MTTYDIAVPLIALGFGLASVLYVRWASIRLDARLEAEAEERRRHRR